MLSYIYNIGDGEIFEKGEVSEMMNEKGGE